MQRRKKEKLAKHGGLISIASRARVSTGTVSRALNNSELIPSETRSRIIEIARELGFRPRVKIRNKQIALITEPPHKTIMGGYVNTLTQYICYALSKQNAEISIITEDRIEALSNCWFDGIIGIAWEEKTVSILKKIQNIPIVWFSDNLSNFFHVVYVDAEETGKMVGKYLFEKGHRRIAVIHDPDYTGNERAKGVKKGIEEINGENNSSVFTFNNTLPLNITVKKFIDDGCTAVWVTGEDMKVLEVNWIIQELAGKQIPNDISIIGFENPGISEFQRPSLTTVATPLQELAEKAVEIVLNNTLKELQKIKMYPKIIERNSVKNIGGKV
ncbi:MAG TPA: LacI family DNA-binding transcriptional regulator [Victivallales bacterium]|nr:LacI family DNA-binding transcriptional regulator [Victivallales bacterium]HPO90956.1 LacI family DNA-binding transcriptional regulator [Victivallales bacterium]